MKPAPERTAPELWLLAGQSNMEGQGDLADAPEPDPRVRVFTLDRGWRTAEEPLHSGRNGGKTGVGPGLWFGRLRAAATGGPVGLVATAVGGTSLTEWAPPAVPGAPGLYTDAVMAVRKAGGRLQGILWYQGCNDTNPDDAGRYTDRMVELIAAFRRDFGRADLPVVVAQLGRTVGRTEDHESWNAVQEAQRRLPERISHLKVVATVDLELDDWIHLSARAQGVLAARFADPRLSPQPVRAVWEPAAGWSLRVEFDHVAGGWAPAGLPRGFSLVDAQGQEAPVICRTRVEGSTVHLRLTTDDLAGLTLAYGRGCDPAANLVDAAGRALPVFLGLPLEGLPPVTPWVRHWRLRPFGSTAVRNHTVTGWWYLVLSDHWSAGGVEAFTRFACDEPMDVELRLGNDVPFVLWLDGTQRLAEGPGPRLTSTNIDLEHHRCTLSLAAGVHEVRIEARPRTDGGLGLDLRFARTDAPGPLPRLLDSSER